MRRGIVFLVLVVLFTGGIFAQTNTVIAAQEPPSNWFSAEISVIGAGVRYERMLTDKFSVGVNAYYNSIFIWEDWEIAGSVRFYPFGEGFFLGANVGFHSHSLGFGFIPFMFIPVHNVIGVAISPEIGWRTDPGPGGGFFLSYGVKVPIIIGGQSGWINEIVDDKITGIGVAFSTVPYLGLGYAF
jgi:hypothetical protein